ncbi:MAG: SUMF1/EgtB/PvdO family nonheme iron enzyme [Chloroflexota bacterium]
MDALTVAIAVALAEGLVQVGGKLAAATVDAALKPAKEMLEARLLGGFRQAEKDHKLLKVVQGALQDAGAPVDDSDKLKLHLKRTGLARLSAEGNHALRRQAARAVLAFTDPQAGPPEELVVALGWPRSQKEELARLLAALRAGLAGLQGWGDLVRYADAAAERSLLSDMLAALQKLDSLYVQSEAGQALRVVIEQHAISTEEAARIEEKYRADLICDYYWHDFRGIVQMKRDIRLPLVEIYMELGLLGMGDEAQRQKAQERLLALRDEERLEEEERRLEQQRVSDALRSAQRLVILGEPGAGKTISLRFIALLLAYGYGAARLGLDQPYIPLVIRLADFARALESNPALPLDAYLLEHVRQAYVDAPNIERLFLHHALEQGACMVLLDGLDEVGGDPLNGRPLRVRVVQRVQQLADRWCNRQRGNRLVVTSRIEGYWDEALRGFEHTQLSPLRPPDEVEEFLLRWYTAHERSHQPDLPLEQAEKRAAGRVAELLPSIMNWPSVRRLATNPLLLTILALIHENVGRLPNRRIKLYEIAAQTLIESWRRAQTGMPNELLAEFGEETVMRVMAPLAYWLHEERPGGTAQVEEWQARLTEILSREGYEQEARLLTERFLHHARHEAGLLAERGLGQYGFFHLTFEEYLAARQIARQRAEERCKMLQAHWADPRWQEVILLAAGQIGIVESRTDDASDYIEDLLKMETADRELAGRPALLAGRALADIGLRSVKNATRRWTLQALHEAMQDLDPDTGKPNETDFVPLRTRAAAGDVLDELGWLPPDLYEFVRIDPAGLAQHGLRAEGVELPFYLGKYPVTNAQYARFVQAEDFADPLLWRGFPKFDERSRLMQGDWGEAGWEWLQSALQREAAVDGRIYPRYWNDPRFGVARRGVPVVGVTWYEASAYCRWLARHWGELEEGPANPGLRPAQARLPREAEWALAAGGEMPRERFPWDAPGAVTQEKELEEILRRANVEGKIGRTTPVGMYPLGASWPFGLRDLAGNAWEWQANFVDKDHDYPALRGGAWSRQLVRRPFVRPPRRSSGLSMVQLRFPGVGPP